MVAWLAEWLVALTVPSAVELMAVLKALSLVAWRAEKTAVLKVLHSACLSVHAVLSLSKRDLVIVPLHLFDTFHYSISLPFQKFAPK